MESLASWEVSARLKRVVWLAHASNVEAKLQRLAHVVKANFNLNQPPVPRGNPDGGQWTSAGGGSGRVRLARAIPPEEERDFEDGNPASEAEFEAIEIERQELIRSVREIDPTWSPRQNATRSDSIERDIAKARGERDEAEARLKSLGEHQPKT